jgi:O-antigen/teichoic acid export membrane protein
MLDRFMTVRNLRIVAGASAFVGALYAVTAVMCVVKNDLYHGAIALLVLSVVISLALASWLKARNLTRPVPRWLRVGCFVLACGLLYVMFNR